MNEVMSTPHQETRHAPTTDALWLEVQLTDERWLFEFRADDEAAITVGSHPSAQVHIVSPGVAATHFHFEREQGDLVVVPGYRAGLRVNAMKAPGPTRLSEHATIEFCAISLQTNVHRTRPANFRGQVSRRSATPAEYLRALPSETDATGVTLPATPPLPTFSTFDTMEAVAPRFKTEGLVSLGAAPLPNAVSALGPQGTVIMRAVRPAPELAPRAAPPVASLGAYDLSRTERIPAVKIEPKSKPVARDSTPTRAELPALRRSSAPPPSPGPTAVGAPVQSTTPVGVVIPVGTEPSASVSPVMPVRALLPEPATSMKTADFDVAAMAPFLVTPATGLAPAPVASLAPELLAASEPAPAVKTIPTPPVASRAPAWVVKLGRVAQRQPLPIAAAALGGSLVLALAFVGIARLTHDAPHARAQERRPSASAMMPAPTASARSAERSAATTQAPVPEEVQIWPSVDPKQLLEATTHLASGRYAEAEVAYRALASTKPGSPAYAGIADMLERSRSARCRQKPPASGCPEVIP